MIKCKLCRRENELRKSHIISEFMYKEIYEENIHRFSSLSPLTQRGERLYEQKGIRELLLCQDCETQFSRYEDYVSKELKKIQNSIDTNLPYVIVNNIDYKNFKLFQLSILWRASVSKIFKSVSLGIHEEILREMLVNENPGNYFDYGCILESIVIDDEFTYRAIIEPYTDENLIEDQTIINFIFGGFWWKFCISHNSENFSQKMCFLQENNTLPILKSNNATNEKIIDFHVRVVANPIVKDKVYKNNLD